MTTKEQTRALLHAVVMTAQLLSASLATQLATAADAGVPAVAIPVRSSDVLADAGSTKPARPGPTVCREHIPEGAERPQMDASFPTRGQSGHVALLKVTLSHWAKDRVLADTLEVQQGGKGAKAIKAAGFLFPAKQSDTKPQVQRTEKGDRAETQVVIPVIPLPSEPGRANLTLPSLPIALARASGQVLTLCTPTQDLLVEEPTANFAEPTPRQNPPPLRQMEYWRTLHNLAYGALVGLVAALLALIVFRWWKRRPRIEPPAPPPRPPWEVAIESLRDLKHAGLLDQGRLGDYYDRVSLTLRMYLGDRYGFDGPESTSEEIRKELAVRADVDTQTSAFALLDETDLVKFANLPPTKAQCEGIWDRTEALVLSTTPTQSNARLGVGPAGQAVPIGPEEARGSLTFEEKPTTDQSGAPSQAPDDNPDDNGEQEKS